MFSACRAVDAGTQTASAYYVATMSAPHINETATKSQPKHAAVGELSEAASIESVTAALGDVGIDADRVYFLVGEDGAAALDNATGFFSVFDDVIEKPLQALRAGNTLVGVFGVDGDSADSVKSTLRSAGVRHVHYFGRWTYS